MILRKPYAFLIKYFKIIHIVLLLPLIYIAFKTNGVVNFFETMVASNYVTNEVNIASSHINIFLYLSLFIVLASAIAIYMLMKEKNKKTFYYIAVIFYYSIVLVGATLTYNQMYYLEKHDAIAATIRVFRDFANILYYPQIIFIFYTFFRGIGFDIKSFNFSKDLEELELDDDDDEEVEIDFGKNNYKYKRSFRKTIREFKYYVLENKLVFTGIVIVLFIFLISNIFVSREVYNKKISMGQVFSSNGLLISVNDSILTNLDYKGNIITKDKYYLAIKVAIANRSKEQKSLDKDNFRIFVNGNFIYPTLDKTTKFLDYGAVYFGDPIEPLSSKEYVVVFELTEEQYKKNFDFRVLDSIVYGIGELHPKYRMINLSPTIETKVENMGTVNSSTEISLVDTTLNKSSFKIDDYYFTNKFDFTYEKCISNNCKDYTGSIQTSAYTYLVIDPDLEIDENTYYYKNKVWRKDFIQDFTKIRYTIRGDEKEIELLDKTPAYYTGNKKVYQVPKELTEAEEIDFIITIRDRMATIVLARNN